jgi:hypothetical protein
MIMLHPADLDLSIALAQPRSAAPPPVAGGAPLADAALIEALASDPAFEIDWFLAAVLMSTPAAERAEAKSLPLAS